MSTIEVEVEAACDKCGADLTITSTATASRNISKIVVAPCDDCLSDAKDNGYSQAVDEMTE